MRVGKGHMSHRSLALPTCDVKRKCCLQRDDAVAERGDPLILRQPVVGVGDPAVGEAHEPFHELGCWSRPCGFVQKCGGWGFSSGDVFPSGDRSGVASPAVKMPSIRLHRVSDSVFLLGEPCGP